MPALGTIVTSITNTRIMPNIVENYLLGNVLTMRLMRDRTRDWNGGVQHSVPVNIQNYTAVGSFSGFDQLPTAQQNTRQNALYQPSEEAGLITLSGIQQAINKGEAAAVDLVAAESKKAADYLRNNMAAQLYSDGTGNSNKDIVGLTAIADDGTNVVTYAGLSRNTNTTWKGNYTSQSGAIALSDVASDIDSATKDSNDGPTLIVTTQAIYSYLEALYTPTVQNVFQTDNYRVGADGIFKVGANGILGGNQGFRALLYRGIPIVADQQCPTGKMFTLNENHLYFVKIEYGPQIATAVKDGFQFTGFRNPVNQVAMVGYMLWAGQFVCDSPRTQAQRVSITA